MKTLEDWRTAYYEQQALHTESNGMLCQERDAAIKRAEKAEAELAVSRANAARYRADREKLAEAVLYAEGLLQRLRTARDEIAEAICRFELMGKAHGALSLELERIDAALAKNPTDKAVRVGAEAAGSSCDPVNVHARIAEIDAADAREAIPVGGVFEPDPLPIRYDERGNPLPIPGLVEPPRRTVGEGLLQAANSTPGRQGS